MGTLLYRKYASAKLMAEIDKRLLSWLLKHAHVKEIFPTKMFVPKLQPSEIAIGSETLRLHMKQPLSKEIKSSSLFRGLHEAMDTYQINPYED